MADERSDTRERTEQPTPRRLEQAREEGQVARSVELAAAAGLIAGALLLGTTAGSALAHAARQTLQRATEAFSLGPLSASSVTPLLEQTVTGILLAWLPFAGGVAAAALAIQLVQTRGVLSWKPVEPKFSNLNPAAGLKRIFGTDGLVQLLKSVLKLTVLVLVTWSVFARHLGEMLALSQSGPEAAAVVLRELALRLVLTTALAFLAVALLDYAFQWFKLHRQLRMTREEVVREHRETDGDPMIKARMRSVARSLARRRMMQQVPNADVVVVNPTHIAVALRYAPHESPAPIVVAMGERRIAERIRAIAEKAGVPIVENRPVARALLATASVGRAIPAALYLAVAEILAWVHRRHGLRHLGTLARSRA
ncbi:MAG TPA: flagellar biosynthesis protein FlhB [Candidatus Sulfotelmatobacter sp.]|nr:flagellar biosynthesis protein FlhB [Candidatus Sulfotelmatobacter sp.]